MFTFFTDRDGKFQLSALAESGFDPLARTVRFMLTEEAHHMFVGETGIARVIQRTCEVMRDQGVTDADAGSVRRHGVIDFDMLQRFVNFHYSVTLDLFGGGNERGRRVIPAGSRGDTKKPRWTTTTGCRRRSTRAAGENGRVTIQPVPAHRPQRPAADDYAGD